MELVERLSAVLPYSVSCEEALLSLESWSTVRDRICKVNPSFASVVDGLGVDYPLLIARYPYGVDFLKDGKFSLPFADGCKILNDAEVPEAIQDALGYTKLPLGILLSGSAEVYCKTSNSVVPLRIWNPGDLCGVWEWEDKCIGVDSSKRVCLSSGIRSLFMVPPIADQVSHNRLQRRLGVIEQPPRHLFEQRELFASIQRQENAASPWYCEVLYWTAPWFEHQTDPTWYPFYNSISTEAWLQSSTCRKQFSNTIEWDARLSELSRNNVYLHPRELNHLRHLLAIIDGVFPGMSFATSADDHSAPLQAITTVYQEHYRLKYAPIMMIPKHISSLEPLYYSLNAACHFDPGFTRKSNPRVIKAVQAVCAALKALQISDTYPVNFNFYHAKPSGTDRILPVTDLMTLNCKLQDLLSNFSEPFSATNVFLNGCVEISSVE